MSISVVLYILGGVVFGSLLTNILYLREKPKTFGTLRIDQTDPENVKMRIELDDIDPSQESKIVLLVDCSPFASQK